MHTRTRLCQLLVLLVLSAVLLVGCAGPVHRDLAAKGVTRSTTTKLVFVGMLGRPRVTVTDPSAIDCVWRTLDHCYNPWHCFGYESYVRLDRVELYTALDASSPTASIRVCAGDYCYVEGEDSALRQRHKVHCEGIGAIIDASLDPLRKRN